MIIQPDFLDHYKTVMLCDMLDDPCAPLYLIRLWGHCQNRKTHRFDWVNPIKLKAVCKSPHDADLFHSSMIECGFLRIESGETVAHEWDSINASLIANWENGKKGGRPKNKTQTKPMGIPSKTHAEPIREEKKGLEKKGLEKNKANDYDDFLSRFNSVTGKRCRVVDQKTKGQLRARLKDGFTIEEIIQAAENCAKDDYHVQNPKYLTPEFITRADKLQKYLAADGKGSTKQMSDFSDGGGWEPSK